MAKIVLQAELRNADQVAADLKCIAHLQRVYAGRDSLCVNQLSSMRRLLQLYEAQLGIFLRRDAKLKQEAKANGSHQRERLAEVLRPRKSVQLVEVRSEGLGRLPGKSTGENPETKKGAADETVSAG